MTTKAKTTGRIVHYVFRGGKPNDMTSECGKSMETPNASYTTTRTKVTCKKCLKASHDFPDLGGDPKQMVRKYDVQLEIDCSRGVIYAHCKNTDISILRICGVPMPAMRGLAGTPVEFVPQLDISLRENLPAFAGVANLAMARKEAEFDKAREKKLAAKKAKQAAELEKIEKRNGKAKPAKNGRKIMPVPAVKAAPYVCFRMYVNGKFKDYSYESNEKAAIRVYRKKHRLADSTDVQAKVTLRR